MADDESIHQMPCSGSVDAIDERLHRKKPRRRSLGDDICVYHVTPDQDADNDHDLGEHLQDEEPIDGYLEHMYHVASRVACSHEEIMGVNSRTYLNPVNAGNPEEDMGNEHQPTRHRGIAKVVMCAAVVFIVVCFLMVGASLLMSEDIDQKANLSEREVEMLDRKELERKRIARAVALVSGILFLVSVALVTVSLFMAKDIDEMVRNSNEMLKKHNDRMAETYSDVTTDVNTTFNV